MRQGLWRKGCARRPGGPLALRDLHLGHCERGGLPHWCEPPVRVIISLRFLPGREGDRALFDFDCSLCPFSRFASMGQFFCTFTRIELTSQPRDFKAVMSVGASCLNLAAAEVLLTSRHQTSPSMGPGFVPAIKGAGMSGSSAFRRAWDSLVSSASRYSIGDACAACISDIDWFRRVIGVGESGYGKEYLKCI